MVGKVFLRFFENMVKMAQKLILTGKQQFRHIKPLLFQNGLIWPIFGPG